MDDKLTALARRTGVEEYRLAMFGVMVSTPLLFMMRDPDGNHLAVVEVP